MSMCVCSYILFWEGTGGEEESVVMELWQGDSLLDVCYVSNWRCPNSPSLSGEGKEEGRARVKMAPKPINCRNKYKPPPSLLLFLPIVFHAQSFSIPVIIGRHNGITFLHCFEGGSSSRDGNVSRVRRGGRGGWGELPHRWLWFLGSGLLNCAKAARRWLLWSFFLDNWNPMNYLHFEFEIGQAIRKQNKP